jgi:signal peptidase I
MRTTKLNTFALSSLLREGMGTGHMPYLKVTSGSMAPLLQVGDEVGVQPVTLKQLRPGDIIIVSDRDQILTHRFINVRSSPSGPVIVTQGDRARVADQPWAEQQLLGRVVLRRRQRRVLWLDFGVGQRLNRVLAGLSRLQRQLLNHVSVRSARAEVTRSERVILGGFRRLAAALTVVAEWIH